MGLLLLGLYLVYSMRLVRKQFNEFENVRSLAVAIVLAPVLFLLVNAISGPEHGKFRRRMEVSLSIVITGIIFWTPVYAAVWAFIVKDEVRTAHEKKSTWLGRRKKMTRRVGVSRAKFVERSRLLSFGREA